MGDSVLICSPNWLGDVLMFLPAYQTWVGRSVAHSVILARPRVSEVWEMVPQADDLIRLSEGWSGTVSATGRVRRRGCRLAIIGPQSFRSALIAFLAGVPQRIGYAGHWRRFLLTGVVGEPQSKVHQALEYTALFFGRILDKADLMRPQLKIPEPAAQRVEEMMKDWPRPQIALFPGAQRGPSKRWPPECYARAARALTRSCGGAIVVLGTRSEAGVGGQITAAVGPNAYNLCGEISLCEVAAVVERVDLVISGDSGGMHLADVLGTAVVAIFGLTDPQITGPIWTRRRVLQAVRPRDRAIPRQCPEAEAALRAVTPEQVVAAALELMDVKEQRVK